MYSQSGSYALIKALDVCYVFMLSYESYLFSDNISFRAHFFEYKWKFIVCAMQ